jgi:hypothetical protein
MEIGFACFLAVSGGRSSSNNNFRGPSNYTYPWNWENLNINNKMKIQTKAALFHEQQIHEHEQQQNYLISFYIR